MTKCRSDGWCRGGCEVRSNEALTSLLLHVYTRMVYLRHIEMCDGWCWCSLDSFPAASLVSRASLTLLRSQIGAVAPCMWVREPTDGSQLGVVAPCMLVREPTDGSQLGVVAPCMWVREPTDGSQLGVVAPCMWVREPTDESQMSRRIKI